MRSLRRIICSKTMPIWPGRSLNSVRVGFVHTFCQDIVPGFPQKDTQEIKKYSNLIHFHFSICLILAGHAWDALRYLPQRLMEHVGFASRPESNTFHEKAMCCSHQTQSIDTWYCSKTNWIWRFVLCYLQWYIASFPYNAMNWRIHQLLKDMPTMKLRKQVYWKIWWYFAINNPF